MLLGKGFLRAIRFLALHRLDRLARKFRQHQASLQLAFLLYGCNIAKIDGSPFVRLIVKERLRRKIDFRRTKKRKARKQLESFWMFLREIRVSAPEWGDNLEEFLQSIPQEPSRKKLLNILVECLYRQRNLSALSR